MDKNSYREEVKKRISEMTEQEKKQESEIVCKTIIQLLKLAPPQTLVTYDAMSDEIDIIDVVQWAQEEKIEIIPIKIDTLLADLEVPNTETCITIIPGRAFAKDGRRLGRGHGYYDQLLTKFPKIKSIGACFACQVFDELPQESWDRKVGQVVFAGNILN